MAKKNYSTIDLGGYSGLSEIGRVTLRKKLGLTGCEVSFNSFEPGKESGYLHAHKRNEEVYIVISGDGKFQVDGDVFSIEEGSVVRVAPEGSRAFVAGERGLTFLCIQADQGSLKQATTGDAFRSGKVVWP